ncbi:MAG: hypothetical protein WDN44_12050 [Sphingomonas sp.]
MGNPALKPYLSTNFDLGFEFYTGHEGYIGFTAFRKALTGFTVTGTATVPFSSLAQYGVTYDTLTPTQQAAINAPGRGGPGSATVVLSQQVNATGTLKVNGPRGELGAAARLPARPVPRPQRLRLHRQFDADQPERHRRGAGGGDRRFAGDLQHHRLLREGRHLGAGLDDVQPGVDLVGHQPERHPGRGALQRRLPAVGSRRERRLGHDPRRQGPARANLTKEQQRSYFQFPNATFTQYQPGRQVMIGLRGRF